MGYAIAMSQCWICHRTFGFNPVKVPSVPILPNGEIGEGGVRQPVCRDCATRANEVRRLNGLELWDVSDEAYGPVEEGELDG